MGRRVAEPEQQPRDPHLDRGADRVHQTAGVKCTIVLVPPKSLPFTSSGKLSRAGAKDGYLAGEIAEISPLAPVPHHSSAEVRLEAAQ